jgi:hypothetical protein
MTITAFIRRRILTRRGLGSAAIVLAAVVGYTVHAARAGIPATKALVYAGTLMDGSGKPLTDQHSVEVGVYSAASGGSAVCPVVLNAALTPDATGGFKVQLDDACAAQVEKNADLWVEVKVDGTPLTRSKLGAVPYAIEAKHADTADKAADSALLEGNKASAFQLRGAGMSTTCAGANKSIKTIATDGTVTCETDADITYAAGSGLTLASTTFSIGPTTVYDANTAAVDSATTPTAKHAFCAITRVYQYTGGDVSNRTCAVTKDAAGGTWTLTASALGGAPEAYIDCEATCF